MNRAILRRACPIICFATLSLFAFVVLSKRAHAQNDAPSIPRPFAVKLGLFLPNDTTMKNVFGETWFSGGVSYDFAKSKTSNPIVYQFYADYTKRRTARTGGAEDSNGYYSAGYDATGHLLGLGPAAKFLLAPLTARAQPYVGIGVGYYHATVPVQFVLPVASQAASATRERIYNGTGIGTRSTGALGSKIFAGYQIKEGFFVEADFTYVREIDYIKTGGIMTRLGYRF